MTTKKQMLLAVTSAVLLSGGLFASSAFAQDSTANNLVAEIANKFHVKQSDVKAVFDQHKQEMDATRQQKLVDRLTKAVNDGKLTSVQKELILAKLKEVDQRLADSKNITDPAARKAAIDQLATDLKTWASQNNIDLKYLPLPGQHPLHKDRPRLK